MQKFLKATEELEPASVYANRAKSKTQIMNIMRASKETVVIKNNREQRNSSRRKNSYERIGTGDTTAIIIGGMRKILTNHHTPLGSMN